MTASERKAHGARPVFGGEGKCWEEEQGMSFRSLTLFLGIPVSTQYRAGLSFAIRKVACGATTPFSNVRATRY